MGIAQGSEKEWNHVWEKSKKTKVASEAEIMMHALAFSQEPWLLWRYAVLLFADIQVVQWTMFVNEERLLIRVQFVAVVFELTTFQTAEYSTIDVSYFFQ